MKRLLFLMLILFISISAVSAADDFTDDIMGDGDNATLPDDANVNVDDNSSQTNGSGEDEGSSDVNESGENEGSSDVENDTNVVEEDVAVSIKAKDFVWYYKGNPVYNFTVVNSNGTGVEGQNVKVTLNKKHYSLNTDVNGMCFLPVNLNAGTYKITLECKNSSATKSIKLFSSRVTNSKDITSTYGTKAKYQVRVLDNAGNPISGTKVTFTINKKSWTRTTSKNGYATIYFNHASGKYTIKYSTNGFTGKSKYTVNNFISLKILEWGLKGDVSKAPLIKKNMPNNPWVKKAVAATKKGLPLLTIKGGNGKVVFMTAGVHGNELNSQVAAMKMIKYLTTHPIKGTVYIVPFVNVKAISQKVRLTDYDFNRVAHRSGTVSNKLVKLIVKSKCDAYGDFHTTVSPGVPGINVVLGYTSPSKCVPLTKYIAKNAGVNKIFYYPGEKYRWSLADWVNDRGTPAVICEVISPVNVVSTKATNLSYKEMTAFLNYNKIL